jgi:hypothetical protein
VNTVENRLKKEQVSKVRSLDTVIQGDSKGEVDGVGHCDYKIFI